MTPFADWIEQELKQRGWKPADLTAAARLGAGTLSNILSEDRKPGPSVCLAIAQALDYPPEEVFRLAGLLPTVPKVRSREAEM